MSRKKPRLARDVGRHALLVQMLSTLSNDQDHTFRCGFRGSGPRRDGLRLTPRPTLTNGQRGTTNAAKSVSHSTGDTANGREFSGHSDATRFKRREHRGISVKDPRAKFPHRRIAEA